MCTASPLPTVAYDLRGSCSMGDPTPIRSLDPVKGYPRVRGEKGSSDIKDSTLVKFYLIVSSPFSTESIKKCPNVINSIIRTETFNLCLPLYKVLVWVEQRITLFYFSADIYCITHYVWFNSQNGTNLLYVQITRDYVRIRSSDKNHRITLHSVDITYRQNKPSV